MDWITHDEDVWFDFRGSSPEQLTDGRYYRGTVDGFADFGVFVDLAPGVTGLLHRSELDQRLESLDWEPGDTVFVQVKNVRDNGNVDLAWSIRQSEEEFRGARVHDPEGDENGEEIETEASESEEPVRHVPTEQGQGNGRTGDETEASTAGGEAGPAATTDEGETTAASESAAGSGSDPSGPAAGATPSGDRERVAIDALDDHVGGRVRVEAEVTGIRQTSGPTVFELHDETGTVDAAAFVEPGARAYPDVEVGDVVRLDGEVERRRGELQVETEALAVLDDAAAAAVRERRSEALDARAAPERVEPLADHEPVAALTEAVGTAATAIRRAVLQDRPVVVRHATTADGYVAGAAIERATLPLIRETHEEADAEYHYFERRPLDDPVYGMDPATRDTTRMLSDSERFGEQLPLVVLVGAGSTAESLDGLRLLGIYDAERLVVDSAPVDDEAAAEVETTLAPESAVEGLTNGALAATLAAAVNDDVRDSLAHLPATSYWGTAPEAYVDLAAEHGYDADECRKLREAVALEAGYQTYEDKRELISDLLFEERAPATVRTPAEGREAGDLAEHVSEQFREKIRAEVETAEANLERRETDDISIAVLDADAYAHRFDFPPTGLLLDELHRRQATEDGASVTVGVDADELFVRSTADVDVRAAAELARERVPNAGIEPVGVREGRVAFLSGEREAVVDAVIRAVVEQITA
ncbi:MAG: OB-fold nucleic acid binding domain-containing protein [Haloferacaceae archaeon]